MTLDHDKGPFYQYSSSPLKVLYYPMQSKLSSIAAEFIEKDRWKGVEMTELTDAEKCTVFDRMSAQGAI